MGIPPLPKRWTRIYFVYIILCVQIVICNDVIINCPPTSHKRNPTFWIDRCKCIGRVVAEIELISPYTFRITRGKLLEYGVNCRHSPQISSKWPHLQILPHHFPCAPDSCSGALAGNQKSCVCIPDRTIILPYMLQFPGWVFSRFSH